MNVNVVPLALRLNWLKTRGHDPVGAAKAAFDGRERVAFARSFGWTFSLLSFLGAWYIIASHVYAANHLTFGACLGILLSSILGAAWSRLTATESEAVREVKEFMLRAGQFCTWTRTPVESLSIYSQEDLRKKADDVLMTAAFAAQCASDLYAREPTPDNMDDRALADQDFREKFTTFEMLGLTKGDWSSYYRRVRGLTGEKVPEPT